MKQEQIVYLKSYEKIIPIQVSKLMMVKKYSYGTQQFYTTEGKIDDWSFSLTPEDESKLAGFIHLDGANRYSPDVLINPEIDRKNQLDWFQMRKQNDIASPDSDLTTLILKSGESFMLKWKYADCMKYFGKNPEEYSDPDVYRMRNNSIEHLSRIRKILLYSSRCIKFYKVFTYELIEERRVSRKTTPEDIMKQFRLPKDSFSWKKDGPRLLIGTRIVEQKGENQ